MLRRLPRGTPRITQSLEVPEGTAASGVRAPFSGRTCSRNKSPCAAKCNAAAVAAPRRPLCRPRSVHMAIIKPGYSLNCACNKPVTCLELLSC